MKKYVLLLNFCLFVGVAKAEVSSQALCLEEAGNSNSRVVFKTYLDTSLNKLVGAFVKYRGSRDIILLVYVGDEALDDSNDYELLWLEVFMKKTTGEYRLIKPRGKTIMDAYILYKNYRTGKKTLFSPSGKIDSECLDFIESDPG